MIKTSIWRNQWFIQRFILLESVQSIIAYGMTECNGGVVSSIISDDVRINARIPPSPPGSVGQLQQHMEAMVSLTFKVIYTRPCKVSCYSFSGPTATSPCSMLAFFP